MAIDKKLLEKWRGVAGLPLLEADDATESHMEKEERLFHEACSNLKEVVKMAEQRLAGELSDEHKAQYTALHKCAKECCDLLTKHVESYEKKED